MSNYNPIPTRVWSRVQSQCTFTNPGATYDQIYIPLTNQIVSQKQADYENKQIYKGNILQYKGNSARLTKAQKYSQLAKMNGPNRTKVFATQSQTYSNPNTTGLLRVGYSTYQFPNQIPGAPNNISGPFAYGIPDPNDCSGNSIQDGGSLVCGTFANPCSGVIIKRDVNPAVTCHPASASNVPGDSLLCWNNKVKTWFPRQRYVMTNSGNKWPEGYKGFVSALIPDKPCSPLLNFEFYEKNIENLENTKNYLNSKNKELYTEKIQSLDTNFTKYNIYFSWKMNNIYRADSFNIYINYDLYKNIINDGTYNTVISNFNDSNCFISMTSVLNKIESDMSVPIFFYDTDISLNTTDPTDPTDCCTDLTNINNFITIIDTKFDDVINYIDNKLIDIPEMSNKLNYIESSINNINDIIQILSSSMNHLQHIVSTKICNSCDIYNQIFNSNIIKQINEYVLLYISSIGCNTNNYITIDTYDELNIGLNNLEELFNENTDCNFYNTIQIYKDLLLVIKTSFDNKNLLASTILDAEKWKNDSIILNNSIKLQEYINNLNKSFYLTDVSVKATYANLKPKYNIYIQLYGLPCNLLFDPKLLNNIIKTIDDYDSVYGIPQNDEYDFNKINSLLNKYSL
jgi:hypothetical protein